MDFARIYPNLPEKLFVQILSTNFFTNIMKTFYGLTSRKGLHVFSLQT